MTTKTIHYATRSLMETGKEQEARNGFRAKQTNFTNNDQRDGFDIFYDNAPDIPKPKRQLTDDQLLDEIAADRNVERI